MTVGDRIRQVRQEQDVTQQELADYIGVSKQAVYKYENNIVTNIPTDKVDAIAKRLKVSPAYLMGWEDKPTAPAPRPIPKGFVEMPEMVNLPVVGKIACGTPILAQQNIETYYQSPKEWRAGMFLTCQGDSMEPFIKDGDMVAIREQQDAETDEIVAVMELDGCDGFATLKKLKKRPDRVELWPLNPEYEPIIYLKEEMNKLQIIGLAVGVIRRIHE